jgi:hypothetical protein
MEQRQVVHFLTVKGLKDLKATEIELELSSVYGDGALQISAVTT